jgi:hypothetical protein
VVLYLFTSTVLDWVLSLCSCVIRLLLSLSIGWHWRFHVVSAVHAVFCLLLLGMASLPASHLVIRRAHGGLLG